MEPTLQTDAVQLYLDLMKRCLAFTLWPEPPRVITASNLRNPLKRTALKVLHKLTSNRISLVSHDRPDPDLRIEGRYHPVLAHTMIGLKRLENIEYCLRAVLSNQVKGDFIETGVWRGGATIFMRAILKAYQITDRKVWVADSFEGVPPPNPEKYPADRGDGHHRLEHLAVSLDEVKSNFAQYNLLDDQVVFLKGWFKDTLPTAPIPRLALLRLDGDLYESTLDALTHLYPKLSIGGYVIIDDFNYIQSCKQAVNDFRRQHSIEDEIKPIDSSGVYWQRSQ
jgi:hypothetical protein